MHTPPKWIIRFFNWYCNPRLQEYLEGDLLELYQRRLLQKGRVSATLFYIRDVLDLIRPFTLRRSTSSYLTPLIYPDMMIHNLKTIFRNLRNNLSHTVINVVGLTLAIVCATLIFLKVRFDTSFERHIPDADQIYRINFINEADGNYYPTIPGPFVELIREQIPEFEHFTVINRNGGVANLSYKDRNGNLQRIEQPFTRVWSNYFEVFSHNWLKGNPNSALAKPYSTVVTRQFAMEHFGTINVIDTLITLENKDQLVITGVIETPPNNTHFDFDIFIRSEADKPLDWMNQWGAYGFSWQCYVKIGEQVPIATLEQKLTQLFNDNKDKNVKSGDIMLHPITDMHLDTRFFSFTKTTVSPFTLKGLGFIALFLLISACINFINLNTALIANRTKEIGVRKILGGVRSQIFRLFLGETALLIAFSFLITFLCLPYLLSYMQPILGEDITFKDLPVREWIGYGLILIIVLLVLAGFYPAYLMAKTRPVVILKQSLTAFSGKGITLRKGLITLQFAISQVLIICMLIAMKQMHHFHNTDLGLDQEAIVEVSLHEIEGTLEENINLVNRLKSQMLSHPNIERVGLSNTGSASDNWWSNSFKYFPEGDTSQTPVDGQAQMKAVDIDYLDTYGLELLAGQDFYGPDSMNHVIVNQQLIKTIGLEDPLSALGKKIDVNGKKPEIIGVVKDFTTASLHEPIKPTIILKDIQNVSRAAIKLRGGDLSTTMAHIEETWKATYPQEVYRYDFLDETIAQFYENETRAMRLFQIASGVALAIGGLGLFGLIAFMATKKRKEIGIRKVLGATIGQILGLFTREFVYLVIIGFVLAAPLAWYIMQQWLMDFTYRIEIHAGFFVATLVLSLLVMVLIVSIKSYNTARMNPVEAIRDE